MIYSVRAHYRSRWKLHLVSSPTSLAEKMFNKQLNRLFCCSTHVFLPGMPLCSASQFAPATSHQNHLYHKTWYTIFLKFPSGIFIFFPFLYSRSTLFILFDCIYVLKANPANNCQNAFMSFSSSLLLHGSYRVPADSVLWWTSPASNFKGMLLPVLVVLCPPL